MATAKKTPTETKTDTPPDTIVIDVPEPADVTPQNEPTMEDFAKRVTPSRTTKGKRVTTVDREIERLRTDLTRNTSMVVLAIHMRDVWTGQLILMNQEQIIDSWLEVARVNAGFRTALLKMLDVGVYAAAVSNTAALIIAILAHRQMLPNSDMMLSAVSHTGLKMPDDEQVAAMEAMFHTFTEPDGDPTVNGSGS